MKATPRYNLLKGVFKKASTEILNHEEYERIEKTRDSFYSMTSMLEEEGKNTEVLKSDEREDKIDMGEKSVQTDVTKEIKQPIQPPQDSDDHTIINEIPLSNPPKTNNPTPLQNDSIVAPVKIQTLEHFLSGIKYKFSHIFKEKMIEYNLETKLTALDREIRENRVRTNRLEDRKYIEEILESNVVETKENIYRMMEEEIEGMRKSIKEKEEKIGEIKKRTKEMKRSIKNIK